MADTRTLKLSLLADVNKFISGMNEADTSTKGLSNKIGKYSKVMAGAFLAVGAAAGAMAIKIGVDSVKAAIEDEKSQRILALQMQKTLGANDKLVAGVEDYISATQLRVGVQDDKLRPSLARLIRSTDDAKKAQDLLNLAIDISTATGKPLEAVTNALGKAYDGNVTSLSKLGLGLDASVLKGGDFNKIGETLRKTYGGFADEEAKSLDGQLRIVNIRFDELKEGIGKRFLPILSDALKEVNKVAIAFSGGDPDGLSARARELKGDIGTGGAGSLGFALSNLAESFGNLFAALNTPNADGSSNTLQTFANALNAVASGINNVAKAYSAAKSFGGKLLDTIQIGEGKAGFASSIPGLPFGNQGPNGRRAYGGPVSMGSSYLVGERGPELFTPSVGGKISPNGGGGVVINLNGIIDAESARRSLERLFQNSTRRTGALNFAGSQL